MYSLNEIDVTLKRAARGAGMPWGMAEEAGKCARWLEGNGLPGAELLLGLLTRTDGNDCRTNSPTDTNADSWTAQSGALCPLMAGVAVADRANMFTTESSLSLGAMLSPLAFVPFAASAAKSAGAIIEVSWNDATVTVSADSVSIKAEDAALIVQETDAVQCRTVASDVANDPARGRIDIAASVWKALGDLGHRTFAPDTEASRLAGAGAGLSDND